MLSSVLATECRGTLLKFYQSNSFSSQHLDALNIAPHVLRYIGPMFSFGAYAGGMAARGAILLTAQLS